jgi:hypothetical protein
MKRDAWTLALAGAGLVSLSVDGYAEEKAVPLLTGLTSTTLSGYVDTSVRWNLGTGNASTPPSALSSGKADGFNLNIVKLTLERPPDSKDEWGAGYKADLIFGPDANALATQSSPIPTAADFGVKQAYVALHAPVGNGLDFKLGVWDTIIGYEVTESVNNPNFTRSYGYTIEPPTHTGIQATYQFSEALSAIVGVADTFGPKINERAFPARAESYKTYMGSLTLTVPKSWGALAGATLTGCIINGFNSGANAANGADQTSGYVGGTLNTPLKGLKVGVSYDYAGLSAQPLSSADYANAAALYASYQATEKLSVHARGEYASSDARTALPASAPILGTTKVVAATATLQYDLWKNVLSRIEFRWDHSASGSPAYGGADPGDAPTKKDSFILLANVSYKF